MTSLTGTRGSKQAGVVAVTRFFEPVARHEVEEKNALGY